MQLFIFAILLLVYFVVHSALASHRVKNILIDKWIAKRYYRIIYNAIAIISLVPILFAFYQIASPLLFASSAVTYLGMGTSFIGLLILVYALSQYNLSEFAGTQQWRAELNPSPQELKQSGINAFVRHPLYFAGLLIIWGGFMYSPSIKILVAALIATLYLYVGTKLEEQKLIIEFGEEYKAYQKKVGMLLPFLK